MATVLDSAAARGYADGLGLSAQRTFASDRKEAPTHIKALLMPTRSTDQPGNRMPAQLAMVACLCFCVMISYAQEVAENTATNVANENDPLLQTHRAALYLDRATEESRVLAARALLLSTSRESDQILLGALASDQPSVVRRAVAIAVCQLRHESPAFVPVHALIDPLFAAINDKNKPVRDAAAMALASYDQDAVLARLIKVAGGKGAIPARLAAIRALGWSVRKSSADALVKLLRNKDAILRAAAIRSLIELTHHTEFGTDVTEWLAWWAAHENKSERLWERDLLRRKRWQAQQLAHRTKLLAKALDQTISAHYMLLAPAEQIKVIGNYLSQDLAALNVAGARLVRRYVLSGGKVPQKVVQRLLLLINHREAEVRAAAVTALPDTGNGELAAAVLGRLAREATARVRIAIAKSLGRWAEPRAVKPLLGLLKDDQQTVVIAAVNALGTIATAHRAESLIALDPLHTLAKSAPAGGNGRLWEATILTLGKIADKKSVPVLMTAMKSTSARTRLTAVVGLGRIADASVATELAGHLDDADTGVREQVIGVLAALGSPSQLPELEKRAADANTPAATKTKLLDAMRQILLRQEKLLAAAPATDALVGVRRHLAQTLVKLGNLSEALSLYAKCAEQLKGKPKPLADLQRERLWVLLAADQAEAFAVLLADVFAGALAAQKTAMREKLETSLKQRLESGTLKSTLAVLEQIASKVPAADYGKEGFAAQLAELQRQTASKIAAADRKRLTGTIERLASADDAVWKSAAEDLRARGKTVVGDLLEALKADIQKKPGQPLFQTRIFDILKTLSAERFEYDPQAESAKRIEAIDRWLKALGATPAP